MKTLALTVSAISCFFCCTAAYADVFGSGTNEFEIEFVTIGNPGNPPDLTGNPRPVGQVDYVYDIGKYEISRAMIDMANANADLNLTLHPMEFIVGGPRPGMPATGVSWNEAARFVNWLNTSQGFPAAYKFATQPGDSGYHQNANLELWEPTDFGYDPDNLFRNTQAHYVLPNADEWYKAAYYEADAFDGEGGYWNFPNGSFEPPIPVASGTEPNTAVYLNPIGLGPTETTQAGSPNHHGVVALGGNVWEWEETEIDLVNDTPYSLRGIRGGRWSSGAGNLNVFDRDDDDFATFELFNTGFRVANVPVPTAQVDFQVSPGIGKFQQAGDNVLLVEEIQDGLRIRSVQTGPPYTGCEQCGEIDEVPTMLVSWEADSDQWYTFHATITSVNSTGDRVSASDVIASLESDDGLTFGSNRILSPKPEAGNYSFTWPFPAGSESFGEVSLAWEFTVVPIDAPIPGDADGDGTVGFRDFLALATSFGKEGLGWNGGDFNLNGTTDFLDFLTLANQFGMTSEQIAAVPEPSATMLLFVGSLCCAAIRKRRTTTLRANR